MIDTAILAILYDLDNYLTKYGRKYSDSYACAVLAYTVGMVIFLGVLMIFKPKFPTISLIIVLMIFFGPMIAVYFGLKMRYFKSGKFESYSLDHKPNNIRSILVFIVTMAAPLLFLLLLIGVGVAK